MFGTIVRRDFLKSVFAATLAIPALRGADARAAGLTPLDPADPTAQSLGFAPNASKVTANVSPTFKSGQHCGVCLQYQGKSSDTTAGCSIFPGHSVPSAGWCSAFVQRD